MSCMAPHCKPCSAPCGCAGREQGRISVFHPSRLGPMSVVLQQPMPGVLRSAAPAFVPGSGAQEELLGSCASSSLRSKGSSELPTGGWHHWSLVVLAPGQLRGGYACYFTSVSPKTHACMVGTGAFYASMRVKPAAVLPGCT